jgi:hypothetical protein
MRKTRRSRMVIFRLDTNEYRSLELAQADSGARNISEYCRGAVLGRVEVDKIASGRAAKEGGQ